MRKATRAAAVALVVVAACSSDGANGDDGSADTTAPTVPGLDECLERSSTVRRQTPAGDADVFLLDARVARIDACSDEVVFEFRSSGRELPPGYEIGYEEGPTFVDFDSGDEFEMSGEAFLVIRLERTGIFEVVLDENGEEDFSRTYVGRESIVPSGMAHLQEARMVEGPPGMIQWVIGLDSERPFTIDASTRPRPLPEEPTSLPDGDDAGDLSGDDETTSGESNTTTTTTTPPGFGAATAQIVIRIG